MAAAERRGDRYRPKRTRRAAPLAGDTSDPHSLAAHLAAYLDWMRTRNYSDVTIYNRTKHLEYLGRWLAERAIHRPSDVTKPVLERYQRWLYYYRKPDGEPLSVRSQHGRLVAVRALFKWLVRNNRILSNPASELELPRLEARLPRSVLTPDEAEQVLAVPDIADPLGLRDRAMLEVLYSTGIRRKELLTLELFDLDAERKTLLVRQGKGNKDRMIPIGRRALNWVRRYLDDVRPDLVVDPDQTTLFLTQLGDPFTPQRLTQLVRRHVEDAAIGKHGSCHLFRHTMATAMLENGADIRFIQAMLGHAKLTTTELYTQVSIRKLQEIHAATHPTGDAAIDPSSEPGLSPAPTRADLLSSLAAEAARERDDEHEPLVD